MSFNPAVNDWFNEQQTIVNQVAYIQTVEEQQPQPVVNSQPKPTKKTSASKSKKARCSKKKEQRPLSSYSLFFRDRRPVIKQNNPDAAFGEISKIISAEWEKLPPVEKAAYKSSADQMKHDYLQNLATTRANALGNATACPPVGQQQQIQVANTNTTQEQQEQFKSEQVEHNQSQHQQQHINLQINQEVPHQQQVVAFYVDNSYNQCYQQDPTVIYQDPPIHNEQQQHQQLWYSETIMNNQQQSNYENYQY